MLMIEHTNYNHKNKEFQSQSTQPFWKMLLELSPETECFLYKSFLYTKKTEIHHISHIITCFVVTTFGLSKVVAGATPKRTSLSSMAWNGRTQQGIHGESMGIHGEEEKNRWKFESFRHIKFKFENGSCQMNFLGGVFLVEGLFHLITNPQNARFTVPNQPNSQMHQIWRVLGQVLTISFKINRQIVYRKT